MNVINKLDPHIADLIAAGEVVERPASVVKELLENAVDAGATQVTVEIKNGGIDLIRVTDNGCGMSRADAALCFVRHATSKIAREEDLFSILTLGFRGEALAAIASVAEIELVTRRGEDEAGTRVTLSGGTILDIADAGCPVGTTLAVRNIFYNTPARMKFLKKNTTEAGLCKAAADRVALSHPEVAVRFIKDGRDAMRTPGDGKLAGAIYGACGRVFASSLIEITGEERAEISGRTMRVWGFVTKPELAAGSRNSQYFILNGRHIRSKTMTAALEEAYRGSTMTGKFPGCVIHAAIDPSYVDVNVHPTKIEVKFADERAVFAEIYTVVRQALGAAERPVFSGFGAVLPQSEPVAAEDTAVNPPSAPETEIPERRAPVFAQLEMRSAPPFYAASRPPNPESAPPDVSARDFKPYEEETRTPEPEPLPGFRIAGELFNTYIIVELPDEVMYIDKHAAHERIIYNKLIESDEKPAAQILLAPVVIPVGAEEVAAIEDSSDELSAAGFEIDNFGGGSVIVREIPQHIDADQAAEVIGEICRRMRSGGPDSVRENILHSIACKAAVKGGGVSGAAELELLVRQVLTLPDVRYCPHGRPVAAVTSRRDFEKGFRRV